MKTKIVLVIAAVAALAACRFAVAADSAAAAQTAAAKPVLTLEVVRAFDDRLPKLTDDDMKQILDTARAIIRTKLSDEIDVEFHDNGEIPLDQLFKSVDYTNTDSYKQDAARKYNRAEGTNAAIFKSDEYRRQVKSFLKQWDIKSLANFFPGKKTENYDDAFDNLMAVYHDKIKWQDTLKTKEGAPLVIHPEAPYQSYVEWKELMFAQDKYDIVLTNGLITYDYLPQPYPHSVTKHAKVGGSSFISPKREPLLGRSLMVNIFEDYSGVEGISPAESDIPRDTRNKIVGAYYFAHEFGHAFFYLVDVYDHPASCLMNSTPGMSDEEGYKLLVSDPHPCPKCRPWIDARLASFKAAIAYRAGDYKTAGPLYLEAAKSTPRDVDDSYENIIVSLCSKANDAFSKTGNFAGMRECGELIGKAKQGQ